MSGKHWTVDRNARLPLKVTESGPASLPPTTLVHAWLENVQQRPFDVALSYKENGEWTHVTVKQMFDTSMAFAKSVLAVGANKHDGVAILGFNSPSWFYAAGGAILAGCNTAGIYTTNLPEACAYIVNHAECPVAAVEDNKQLAKLLEKWDEMPTLKAVVVWGEDPPADAPDSVYSMKDFLALGNDTPTEDVEARMADVDPADSAVFIYTSGTTGPPKGVMLSHDTVTWTARVCIEFMGLHPGNSIISYLPLSHIAGMMVDFGSCAVLGCHIWFAGKDALKGTLGQTLKEVRPHVFLGVPRVWEKIQEGIKAKAADNGAVKVLIATVAKYWGHWGGTNAQYGWDKPWGYGLFKKLVFDKVKEALGLDRAVYTASAAAPIQRGTLDFFLSLDIPIYEIYGMSESCGPETVSVPSKFRHGTVGGTFPGAELRIDNPDENGDGEICFRGRHVMMGYFKNKDETEKAIDENGWLHSGDVGRVDDEGFLKITGRIKELIITAGGENIPPVLIEDNIKKHAGFISNIMVIGDQRKYLTCLVTLKAASNPQAEEGTYEYTGDLSPVAISILAKDHGITGVKTIAEAQNHEGIKAAIQGAIDAANATTTSNAQRVQKFRVLGQDFSLAGTELTPSLKLKRKIAAAKYSDVIESMYA